ncbi:MAG TPA: hypothetical protein VGB09_11245 [Candidatus Binatia bacterium]
MKIPKVEAGAEPFRCHCGSLLARLVPGGVEIKCRRCKRRVVIPLQTDPRDAVGKRVEST